MARDISITFQATYLTLDGGLVYQETTLQRSYSDDQVVDDSTVSAEVGDALNLTVEELDAFGVEVHNIITKGLT